jgi:hypothetical protein
LGTISNFVRNRQRRKSINVIELIETSRALLIFIYVVFKRNILPSLRSVLSSPIFWIVAIAHSGGLMVCSSIRILGTYFQDTSYGVISDDQAGIVSLFLSVGVVVGLFFGGNMFSNLANDPKARKMMISKLYFLTVIMCYCLAFLAIPIVRSTIHFPYIVALFQGIATFLMGAGVAVQVYCIPAIVGCTFGANKGLYASYTDGVAYTVSSFVWSIMGDAVEEGNPQGAGWAYGWAAVALLVVLAGFLMIEFVEHYFCRVGWIRHVRDTKQKITLNERKYSNNNFADDERSIGSITKLAESGKRIWQNRPTLFRRISGGGKAEPDIKSILSLDEDDDDVATVEFENAYSEIEFEYNSEHQQSIHAHNINERIALLMRYADNRFCVDCSNPDPRWVTIIVPSASTVATPQNNDIKSQTVGAFCCSECAGSHRKLGTHLAFVRSIDLDRFKSSEVSALERGGNRVVNALYEEGLSNIAATKISPSSTLLERERFIVDKYAKRKWFKLSDAVDTDIKSEIELVKGSAISQKRNDSLNQGWTNYSPSSVADQNTTDQYESFVRDGTDDSESGSRHRRKGNEDAQSVSSEESDAWHIPNQETRGLDEFVDL